MTVGRTTDLTSVQIREQLGHPIVDGDAHITETDFGLADFIGKVGGADAVRRYEALAEATSRAGWRGVFWALPSGKATHDLVTTMLPRLYAKRLDEAGIDFAVAYTTLGLGLMHIPDDELRRVCCRALNSLYADMFSEVRDRMTPSAVIPMHTPEEAVAELEFVANELKLKTVTVNTEIHRPIPEVAKDAPHLGRFAQGIASPAIDVGRRYDPVWQKCVDLKLSVACHNRPQGPGTSRNSPSNYIYNHLGAFGDGSASFCRAVIMGGVASRFPQLRFAFLEGGAAWAAQLYNSLFEYWEKRNWPHAKEHLDPAKLDVELMAKLFEQYGNDYLTAERVRENPTNRWINRYGDETAPLDEWLESGITKPGDIRDLFKNFYFGCEADDRLNAVAFDRKLHHYNVALNAVLGSDIGHWDVLDMTEVIGEAWGLVESEMIGRDDFRDFAFGNAVRLHAGLNPEFFKGTRVEEAAAKLLAEKPTARKRAARL